MDTAANQDKKDPNSDVPIKALEIQAATHQEIINVGNVVFQKKNRKQQEELNAIFQDHQEKLMKRLEEEKKMALENLKNEHELNIERLQQQYTDMMDDALKEEADRLKYIMDKIALTSLENEKLAGQVKLDNALKRARGDFDNEKAEAIIEVTLEHEKAQKEKEKQLKAMHDASIEQLNTEWSEKMKTQKQKAVIHEDETLKRELEMAEKKFDAKAEQVLLEADRKHQEEINHLNQTIENEKVNGESLQNKILDLNTSIDNMKTELKSILLAFQSFIDKTPGFSPGQSEFLLSNLLPDGFDEFISNSK